MKVEKAGKKYKLELNRAEAGVLFGAISGSLDAIQNDAEKSRSTCNRLFSLRVKRVLDRMGIRLMRVLLPADEDEELPQDDSQSEPELSEDKDNAPV